MIDKHHIKTLLDGYLAGDHIDQDELSAVIRNPVNAELIKNLLEEKIEAEANIEYSSLRFDPVFNKVIAIDKNPIVNPVHRIHFLRRGWFRYAAAVLIICGVGAYLWTTNVKTGKTLADSNNQLQTDILPGSDKAVLSLADGSKIILDSAANGNLAQQGNAAIVKLADGQITYNLEGLAESDVMINTMTTPKGGQYKLTLPDGSKAWLNAASSIQFPAAFVGTTRNVKITGEVYFEIAKNKEKPFVVDMDRKVSIQVLGTSFNINGYEDEGTVKTTLVEGSVRVSNSNKQVILKPGYQAIAGSPGRQLEIVNADIEQALAWKNGVFNFNGLNIREVMAQLARWYDIDVRYEGAVASKTFRGEMYRDVKLSVVLDRFRDMGIKCKMDGKTVIVMQ